MKPVHGLNRLIAIGAGLAVLAPMAHATKAIMNFTRPQGVRDLFRASREAGGTGRQRTSHRTVSMDKRDAAKRRNVLRNRMAHQ